MLLLTVVCNDICEAKIFNCTRYKRALVDRYKDNVFAGTACLYNPTTAQLTAEREHELFVNFINYLVDILGYKKLQQIQAKGGSLKI